MKTYMILLVGVTDTLIQFGDHSFDFPWTLSARKMTAKER